MKKTRKKLRQYYFSSKKAPLFSETISASPSMLRQNLVLERFIRVLMRAQGRRLVFAQWDKILRTSRASALDGSLRTYTCGRSTKNKKIPLLSFPLFPFSFSFLFVSPFLSSNFFNMSDVVFISGTDIFMLLNATVSMTNFKVIYET